MGLIFVAVLVVLALFGGLLGLIRGKKRAIFRLILILLSVAIAFIAMSVVSSATPDDLRSILDKASVNTEDLGEVLSLLDLSPSMLSLVCGMIRPIVFLLVFFLSSVVLLLVFWIGQFFIRHKKKQKKVGLGFLIGCLQGLLVALILLTPITGYLGLLNDTANAYLEKAPEGDELAVTFEELQTTLSPITDNGAFGAVKTMTSPLFNTMITFKVHDQKMNLKDEMGYVLSAYDQVGALGGSGESDGLTKEQVDAFHALADILEESTLFPVLLSEIISSLGEAWQNGEAIAGIEAPELGEGMDELADALYSFFATTTHETIPTDLDTIASLLEVMVESGAFDENAEMSAAVIDEMLAVLNANPRTALLKDAIISLGVKTMVASLGETTTEILENNPEVVDAAVTGLKELAALPEAERAQKLEEMADSLVTEIKAEGLDEDLPEDLIKEITTNLSTTLLEEVEGLDPEEITAETVADILLELGASVSTSTLPQ